MGNDSLGVTCPGCDVELTVNNAGGYRAFCQACVDAMPPFPSDCVDERGLAKGFYLEGRRPNFHWVAA